MGGRERPHAEREEYEVKEKLNLPPLKNAFLFLRLAILLSGGHGPLIRRGYPPCLIRVARLVERNSDPLSHGGGP